jgi:feruloyl esterase
MGFLAMTFSDQANNFAKRGAPLVAITLITAAALFGHAAGAEAEKNTGRSVPLDLAQSCQTEAMQAVANSLSTKVTIGQIPNGPKLPGGIKLVAATDRLPAFCQVTGSYVTNPATGKTANFLATLPANWNSKYLQLGCSGSCGILLMNDPAAAPITITAQGYPGQLLEKGYATFGNDLGHIATGPGLSSAWAIKRPGEIDEEALIDFNYRADQVMARMGKEFTRAFFAKVTDTEAAISKSYFNGCSQGGREALVAAARFPEEFDGIIAGSPAVDYSVAGFHMGGATVATLRSSDATISPQLMQLVGATATKQCDAVDGVTDGLIQNPAACDFKPERDLPRCDGSNTGQCFSQAQTESVSALLSAATDEAGNVVQPGYSVSEPTADFSPRKRPDDLDNPIPWAADDISSGFWATAEGLIGTLVHRNDPAFRMRSIFSYNSGASTGLGGFHTVVPASEAALARSVLGSGSPTAADLSKLMSSRTKLLIYHNLSDQVLTPFMSINLYKRMAALNGGYKRLHRSARLFTLPGTAHCGMAGVGPANFDAVGALEGWVERNSAPNALFARQLDPQFNNVIAGKVDWSKPALRTMPLCKFPEMARYKGKGDVKDAANWYCKAGDTGMLRVGESGRQAGVVR